MPSGKVLQKTIDKILAREELRKMVVAELGPMTAAQIANAKGLAHFMLRDPETGQFQRLTDPDQIQAALNATGAKEGSTYYIWTKDPSIQSFTDLMNRSLDKPTESVDMNVSGSVDVIEILKQRHARKRDAK